MSHGGRHPRNGRQLAAYLEATVKVSTSLAGLPPAQENPTDTPATEPPGGSRRRAPEGHTQGRPALGPGQRRKTDTQRRAWAAAPRGGSGRSAGRTHGHAARERRGQEMPRSLGKPGGRGTGGGGPRAPPERRQAAAATRSGNAGAGRAAAAVGTWEGDPGLRRRRASGADEHAAVTLARGAATCTRAQPGAGPRPPAAPPGPTLCGGQAPGRPRPHPGDFWRHGDIWAHTLT